MTLGNDNGTDGQTDRVRRNMRPPPREEGRIKTSNGAREDILQLIMAISVHHTHARTHTHARMKHDF